VTVGDSTGVVLDSAVDADRADKSGTLLSDAAKADGTRTTARPARVAESSPDEVGRRG